VTAPVIEAGVDTWRLLFKTRANGAEVAKLDRWSAHWIPALSLYCVEGHPSADGLCPGDGLANSYDEVSRALNAEVGSYEFRGVSRRDTTATYRFGDGREGVAVAARNARARRSDQTRRPRRYPSGKRPGSGVFQTEYIRERFHARFAPLYESAKGVTVAGLPVLATKIAGMLAAGELTYRQAERIGGAPTIVVAESPVIREWSVPGSNR
jgi:hypothetical protein